MGGCHPDTGDPGARGKWAAVAPTSPLGTTKATTIRYAGQMAVDSTGPTEAFIRVTRGGAWHHEGVRCRPASRLKTLAGNKTSFIGIRLALIQ